MSGFEEGSEGFLREAIVAACKKLYRQRLIAGSGGSVSGKMPSGDIFISPVGRSRDSLHPAQVSLLIDKNLKGLSIDDLAECELHRELYKKCARAGALIISQPVHALALSLVFAEGGHFSFAVMPELAKEFGPIPHLAYMSPTHSNWRPNILDYAPDHRLILLSRQSVFSWGASLEEAYLRLERFEHYCKVMLLAHSIGTPRSLN